MSLTTRSAAKSLVSLSPLLLLLTSLRSSFGLDSIHVGLFQIIVLLFVRGLGGERVKSVAEPTEIEAKPVEIEEIKKNKVKKLKQKKIATISPYTPALLDRTLYNFLSITEPSYLHLLPKPAADNITTPASAALSSWTVLLDAESLSVLQHPSTKTLYSISASFPDVPLRNLFETLTTIEQRGEWDGMCSGSATLEEIAVGGRKGAIAWMSMHGVAVIKAKDMVLLSVAGQLPRAENEPLRLFCATTSIEHAKKPPTAAYNRMSLSVSGFVAEELVGGGSRVTQITDLSGLGSWVPSAVIRTVTQTMIPKSLKVLEKTAASFDLSKSKSPIEGDEWLPPLLGTSDDTIDAVVEEEEEEEEEEEIKKPLISEEVGSLLTQLRSLTLRLSLLEPSAKPVNSPITTETNNWFSPPSTGELQMLTTKSFSLAMSAGGAIGAATIVAVLAVWGRSRR